MESKAEREKEKLRFLPHAEELRLFRGSADNKREKQREMRKKKHKFFFRRRSLLKWRRRIQGSGKGSGSSITAFPFLGVLPSAF